MAAREKRGWPRALIVILALGIALRAATLAIPSVQHPDEIYQYLEAAHRIDFGYGIVPWEYRVGMRSWLFPLLLAGPMKLGDLLAPGGGLYLLLPRIAMMLASATIILSAWRLGDRVSRRHAIAAALVAATWYELVAASAHPIGEAAGLAAAFGAAGLMFGRGLSRGKLVWAGALLALAGVLRFQYGPALAVLALYAGGGDWRGRWTPMMAGALAMLAVSAGIDLVQGGVPFGWLVENVRQNVVLHKADHFGVAGPFAYVGALGNMWQWAAVPMLVAAYAGMKRQPALFWAALVHFGLHSLIGHKEYRFILLTDGFAVILAAIGTVDLVDAAARRFGVGRRDMLLAGALAIWVAGSVALGAREWNRPLWTARATAMKAFADLRRDPELCGIGILGVPISEFGGYTALHRPVPYYILDAVHPHEKAAARRYSGAFNAIVTIPGQLGNVPAGFSAGQCRSTAGEYIGNYVDPSAPAALSAICVFRRPGRCTNGAQRDARPMEAQAVLSRLGM